MSDEGLGVVAVEGLEVTQPLPEDDRIKEVGVVRSKLLDEIVDLDILPCPLLVPESPSGLVGEVTILVSEDGTLMSGVRSDLELEVFSCDDLVVVDLVN